MAGQADDPGEGRPSAGHRDRLTALHRLSPGQAARPIPFAVAFLMAVSTPAEREAAAQAHDAQAAQLRGPLPAALARAYSQLQPLWHGGGSVPSARPPPWPSC
jgi:hypothetical protein